MTTEIALLLIRFNLSLSAAIVIILLLRGPLRHWCGADLAYRLWVILPFILIADAVTGAVAYFQFDLGQALLPGITLPPLPHWATRAWLAGAGAGFAFLALLHVLTTLRVSSGRAGPAVIGILRPRICLPLDFAERFTPEEQRLVRAYERIHLERHDVLANAGMGLFRCLFWFNPLIHFAAIAMKHDQEMACDALVMDALPDQRRRYARTMLKAQIGPPGVCAFGSHPLEARIEAIVRGDPSAYLRVMGGVGLSFGVLAILAAYAGSIGGGPSVEAIADVQLGNIVRDGWRLVRG